MWKEKVEKLKEDTFILYFALKSPKVPWYSKLFIAIVVGYAFSPIDLIPDFIPVLGHLDDMILLPIGIILAFKMIPEDVIKELREAEKTTANKFYCKLASAVIILIWISTIGLILYKIFT